MRFEPKTNWFYAIDGILDMKQYQYAIDGILDMKHSHCTLNDWAAHWLHDKLTFSFELRQTSSTIAPAHLLSPDNRR